jgi:hypothetical protein
VETSTAMKTLSKGGRGAHTEQETDAQSNEQKRTNFHCNLPPVKLMIGLSSNVVLHRGEVLAIVCHFVAPARHPTL